MRCFPRGASPGLLLLLFLAFALPLPAQQPAPPGIALKFTTSSPEAAAEMQAALVDYWNWEFQSARDRGQKAVSLDPTFGFARAWVASFDAVHAAPEVARALDDMVAANATTEELLLTIALRERVTGRGGARAATLVNAVTALLPGNEQIAMHAVDVRPTSARAAGYRDLMKQYPSSVLPRLALAYTLSSATDVSADIDEAYAVAQEAVRLAPDQAASYLALARVLRRMNRIDEAAAQLALARERSRTTAVLYMEEADIATVQKRHADARAALTNLLTVHPFPNTHYVYERAFAMSLVRDGKFKEGIEHLEATAQRAEQQGYKANAGWGHIYCALLLAGTGDRTAVKHFEHAHELGVRDPSTLPAEAIMHAMLGDADKANAAAQKYAAEMRATDESAGVPLGHAVNGYLHLAAGNPQAAVPEFEKGMKHPYAPIGLEKAYRQLKKPKEAERVRAEYLARPDPGTAASTALPLALHLWR